MSLRLPLRRFAGERIRRWRRYVNELAIIGPLDGPAKAFHYFGEGAAIMAPQGTMYNERYLSIGDGALIGPNVTISAGMSPEQEMLMSPVVSVGRRCVIGRGTHLIGHWSVEIGDDVQMGPNVYVTDQNHGYEDVELPIGQQQPHEAAVSIGRGSWIGTNAVILPGTHLGPNTIVAAGAVVRGTFPARVVLAGVPAKVVRHYDATAGWQKGEVS
jgi:acetyltransferase-like isoleucine patch superfamily enzyme